MAARTVQGLLALVEGQFDSLGFIRTISVLLGPGRCYSDYVRVSWAVSVLLGLGSCYSGYRTP
jgi:hypothetical protein